MNEHEINDIRKLSDFKGVTFSKFKKSDARKELLKALFNRKIEPACYWGAEFICAGHFIDLWNILLYFMSNNIHLGNPKLPLYINLRFDIFKMILLNGFTGHEIRLRNNNKIRKLFAEIISILALSQKKNSFDSIKVDKKDFNMTDITEKLEADNILYAKLIFKTKDPKEFFIAINEIAYHLSNKSKNKMMCCYWIEWILEFERICNAKKNPSIAQRRSFIPVKAKYQMDVIWIIWELILQKATEQGTSIKAIMGCLIKLILYSFYAFAKEKKKIYLIFCHITFN